MTLDDTSRLTILVTMFLSLLLIFAVSSARIEIAKYRKKKLLASLPKKGGPITKYDNLPPGLAVAHAWSESEGNPHLHSMMQDDVRAQMPLLARALDRLVED